MEFLIKWKGQSHLHCQWKSFSELQNVSSANINIQSQIISSLYWNIDFIVSLFTEGLELIFFVIFQLSGFKKVLNYTKKVMEDVKYRRMVSREEVIR